ncbi:MAG: hypothetical protein AAF512_00555 [Pseudomonadota bacterium]
MIPSKNILSIVQNDWTQDGGFDLAVLYSAEAKPDQTNLRLYVSASGNLVTFVTLENAAWQGAMAGTAATLTLNAAGSLVVNSGNESIGRHRWNQKLTIAWRNNTFVVAGFTYIARDTLDPNYSLECDVNLLNGRGIKNGKNFKLAHRAPTLGEWIADWVSEICIQ